MEKLIIENKKIIGNKDYFGISFAFLDDEKDTEIEMYVNGSNILEFKKQGVIRTTRWNLDELTMWLRDFIDNLKEDPYPVEVKGRYAAEKDDNARDFESDDEDEMDNLEGSKAGIELEQDSIVPKDITKARIVALRYNNAIIAYRFKTDKGSYDMTKNTALKYGISGYKIEKVITVSVRNGFYISKKELETRTLVPDISDCEEDCKLLIEVFFNNLNA